MVSLIIVIIVVVVSSRCFFKTFPILQLPVDVSIFPDFEVSSHICILTTQQIPSA